MLKKIATALLLLWPSWAVAQDVITVTDAAVVGDVVWTADHIYVLDGLVFVEAGETLTIEAGTVVKGKPGQGENASALIVARDGKIFAEGTPTQPIIFTAEADDVDDPNDLPLDTRGLWGGVILLGNGRLNSTPGETQIEGIPTTEPRARYGGDDDADDSGVFRYVSIRYGGTDIGAGNEINGLTMGAVGSGTTIEFVEVFGNQDDCFEFFGGAPHTRYLVGAFCGDDTFDYDEGFRGKGQFWFSLQAPDIGNRAGEHDGGTDPEDGEPFAVPTIANATYIGSGAASTNAENDVTLKFRDNAGGKYYNSIFTDFFGSGIDVEDLDSGADSRARMASGDLVLAGNLWWGFGAGNTLEAIAPESFVREHLSANGNEVVDPRLRGISRTNDGGLDPRPAEGSPALTGAVPLSDPFFTPTDYRGAFGETNWAAGWTLLSASGVLTNAGAGTPGATAIETLDAALPETFALEQNYPNPFNPSTTIEFGLERPQTIRLAVYDVLGREVAVLAEGPQPAGRFRATFEAANLPSGVYLYRLQAEAGTLTRTMMLLK
ncbi:T9SS type A sorting domain-containing protein [Rhodocaloribacter sp.]